MKKVKGGIAGISQDYNAVEKWAMTVNLRVAVHANFKDICKKQETRKEKELSRITTRESKLKKYYYRKCCRLKTSQQHITSKGKRERASALFHQ